LNKEVITFLIQELFWSWGVVFYSVQQTPGSPYSPSAFHHQHIELKQLCIKAKKNIFTKAKDEGIITF